MALGTDNIKYVASQLRRPEGDDGRMIAENMNKGNELMNRYTIRTMQIKDGDRVLELGMGNGHFAQEVVNAARNVHYTGCDYAPTMTEASREQNSQLISNGKAEIVLGEAGKLPFDDNSFDKVFAVNVVYFWDKPATEMAEIMRVLKPEGSLFLAIRPKHIMEAIPFSSYNFRLYDAGTIQKLMTDNGYAMQDMNHLYEPERQIAGETYKMECLVIEGKKTGPN